MAFIVPGILIFIGLLLIAFRGCLWLRSPAKRLCPGPRLTGKQRVCPVWLIYRPRCGYDLSGHGSPMARSITCPECGRAVVHRKELIRSARAMRFAHLGFVFVLTGLLVYQYPPLAATKVVEYTPTEILLRGEGILGVGTPIEVREEIRRRAMDHQLRDDQVCRFVQLLINDLQDDNLANNAKAAIEQLAIFGVFCTESLMAALQSGDTQQRALAAEVLRRLPDASVDRAALIRASVEDLRGDRWPKTRSSARWYLQRHIEEAKPLLIEAIQEADEQQKHLIATLLRGTTTEGSTLEWLLQVSMNDLRDDERRGNLDDGEWFLRKNLSHAQPLLMAAIDSEDRQQRDAAIRLLRGCDLEGEALDRMLRVSVDQLQLGSGVRRSGVVVQYLIRHAEAAEPLLLEGMLGDDRRQRLLSAVVAGCTGRVDIMHAAVGILVEHLGDNDVEGDAIIAARAIWGFGPAALPLLEPHRASKDEQKRQCVEYIVRRHTTTESISSLLRELPLARLTQARVDALALEVKDLRMPRFSQ